MSPEPALYAQDFVPFMIKGGLMALMIILAIREMVWKGIALWKAGTQRQIARFVCIFIFNTAGILPILYLIFRQKKDKIQKTVKTGIKTKAVTKTKAKAKKKK